MVRRGMTVGVVAVFHWVSITSSAFVTLTSLFLLVLPDPVPLIMAPGVVRWRTSIFIKESVVTSPALVLTRSENREVALQRFQKFVHNVAPGLSALVVPEGVVLAVSTMVVPVPMVVNSVGRVGSRAGCPVLQDAVVEQLLVVRVQTAVVLAHTLQSITFVVLAVRTVARVDQEEGGALGNIQIGIILVCEVGLECAHCRTLVTVTYADQLVSVAAAPRSEPHNFAKL
jgi:hypothetical protein